MDCEKFESTLLDELYPDGQELDEVTSAAAKRHVGGCARCASLLSGLKATRRIAVLPIVEPPADLEDRIMAAAKEAQKVVPLKRRMSNVITLAGSWAMRPQTAMAALFLLTIGMGTLLLKGKAKPSASMTVDVQGEPVASVQTGTIDRPADPELAVQDKDFKAAAPAAAAPTTMAPAAPSATATSAYAAKDDNGSVLDGLLSRGGGSAGRAAPSKAMAPPSESDPFGGLARRDAEKEAKGEQNAAAVAGAPISQNQGAQNHATGAGGAGYANPPPPKPAPPPQAYPQAPSAAQGGDAYSKKQAPSDSQAAATRPRGQGPGQAQAQTQTSSAFDGAMAAYNQGDYAAAVAQFDPIASTGDLNAALWAARSVRESSGGCQAAVVRFDQVARQGSGSTAGYDAMFDAGRCYRTLGQWDAARMRFNVLLGVPSYINRAQSELNAMGPKASSKPRAASPPPQAAPPNATTNAY